VPFHLCIDPPESLSRLIPGRRRLGNCTGDEKLPGAGEVGGGLGGKGAGRQGFEGWEGHGGGGDEAVEASVSFGEGGIGLGEVKSSGHGYYMD